VPLEDGGVGGFTIVFILTGSFSGGDSGLISRFGPEEVSSLLLVVRVNDCAAFEGT